MKRLALCSTQKKFMYPTRTAAINSAIRSSKKRGTPLRVYWHAECKSYHLSKMSRDEYVAKCDTQQREGAA